MSDPEFEYLWRRRDEILYRAELSTVYHRRRERFFTSLDKSDKLFTLLFGSAAFVQVVNTHNYPFLGMPFVIFALCNLVFGFGEIARKHGELASRFKAVEASIERVGPRDFSEDDLNKWSARVREIEFGEPITYVVLLRLCQNELAIIKGHVEDMTDIPWWRRMLANVFSFSDYKTKTKQPS